MNTKEMNIKEMEQVAGGDFFIGNPIPRPWPIDPIMPVIRPFDPIIPVPQPVDNPFPRYNNV
jgi:bacteriocin-like protein